MYGSMRDDVQQRMLKAPPPPPTKPAYVHSTALKCLVLTLCSALALGSNFCYHSPAALKNQLQQHFSARLKKDQFEVLFVSFLQCLRVHVHACMCTCVCLRVLACMYALGSVGRWRSLLSSHSRSPQSLLYTVYSTPNIVLPFFGGLLVDKFGARQMLLALTLLVVAGQIVLAIGSSVSSFRVMLVRTLGVSTTLSDRAHAL